MCCVCPGSPQSVIDGADLAGSAEVAEMLGISKQNLVNWRARKPDFPLPIVELAMSPIWSRKAIREWAQARCIQVHEQPVG